jgi:hypothetical protein
MIYPLVDELAAAGIPVTVTCGVLQIARLNRPDFRSVLQARMEHDEQEVFAGDA